MSKKILVVDDSVTARRLVVSHLAGLNLQVIEAGDGKDGLSKLNDHPDTGLIFTDINMPWMSGLEMIAEIKKITERKKDIERRTEIILNLQQSRNLPTHVLDELVRIVPPGIYLSSLEKKGSLLLIEGRSESNNNVANMMRKVKASEWLTDPNMQSIVTQDDELRQLQSFSLRVSIKGAIAEEPAKAAKGASK